MLSELIMKLLARVGARGMFRLVVILFKVSKRNDPSAPSIVKLPIYSLLNVQKINILLGSLSRKLSKAAETLVKLSIRGESRRSSF